MGCDIHMHIEIKLDGRWEHWGAPHISRNYRLFSFLAGARKQPDWPEPISPPKGLPDNLSTVTRFAWEQEKDDGGVNRMSWLNKDEIVRLENWWLENAPADDRALFEVKCLGTYLLGNTFGAPKEPIQDVRFVFWFDH
jgi:hypothetical protein